MFLPDLLRKIYYNLIGQEAHLATTKKAIVSDTNFLDDHLQEKNQPCQSIPFRETEGQLTLQSDWMRGTTDHARQKMVDSH